MIKFKEVLSGLMEAKVDKEGYPEVHAHHEALKKRTTKEIHKEHQSVQGRVHGKYTAAEMGGKRGMIGDILRAKHGAKKVKGYFKLDEEFVTEAARGDYHDAKKLVYAYAEKNQEPHPDNYHNQRIEAVHKDRVDTLHKKLKEHGFEHKGKTQAGYHRYSKGNATVDIDHKHEHDKRGYHKDSGQAQETDHHQVVISRKKD